jgi:hypothetical protein
MARKRLAIWGEREEAAFRGLLRLEKQKRWGSHQDRKHRRVCDRLIAIANRKEPIA